jgi:S-(hydroxymethyl)glutathione dehydrogenase/alcohol dehydrogenase
VERDLDESIVESICLISRRQIVARDSIPLGGIAMPRAVVLTKPGARLRVEDLSLAGPGRDQIRIRLEAAGVCHSDLHVYEAGAAAMHVPIVLGHEGAGEVLEVGSDVTDFQIGDHVVLCVMPQCGTCASCVDGQPTLCTTYPQTLFGSLPDGTFPLTRDDKPVGQMAGIGCWSQEAVVHRLSAVKIDKSVPLTSAALLGCAVVTGFGAVVNVAQVAAGDTMAVIGCGGVGLNAVQAGRIAGAERILAVDVNATKLRLASGFGATDLIDSSQADPVEQVRALTEGVGTTFTFDFVGSATTARSALPMTRRGGTVVFTGLANPELTFSVNDLIRAGRTVKGNMMGMGEFRSEYPKLVRLYNQGFLQLDQLVSMRLNLDQVHDAFDAMQGGDVARSVLVMS